MTMIRRSFFVGLGAVALIALLASLRDPPWLAGLESGFRGWETGADGTRYRWTSGHASFFSTRDNACDRDPCEDDLRAR